MFQGFVALHGRLLLRQGRGGPSVLRRPAHRLLLRHRPEVPSPSARQRLRSRHLCVAAEKASAVALHACAANCRPYTLAVSSRPNPAVKRRPNGGRLFTLRAVQRRRWSPLTSTLGQPNANANRRMSESFVALPLPIACPSRPRRAVRPAAAGAPSVASAPPSNAECVSASAFPVASSVRGSREGYALWCSHVLPAHLRQYTFPVSSQPNPAFKRSANSRPRYSTSLFLLPRGRLSAPA